MAVQVAFYCNLTAPSKSTCYRLLPPSSSPASCASGGWLSQGSSEEQGCSTRRLQLSNYERETRVAGKVRRLPVRLRVAQIRQIALPMSESQFRNRVVFFSRVVATLV
jgi:hypothetical protein